jgi:hydrogenase expression/formation protein HypC
MCLAIPGKIITIDDSDPSLKMAKVDFSGIRTDICIQYLADEVKEGDYILAHVGMALSKIDEQEAMETLEALRQLEDLAPGMPDTGPGA